MTTTHDLELLINHLSKANKIFDKEAVEEDIKLQERKISTIRDFRSSLTPRGQVLRLKAGTANDLKKRLLQECDQNLVTLEENTIYAARELIAESTYLWIGRKEPPVDYMETLLADETFIPFAYGLEGKKKRLLRSELHILSLHQSLTEELTKFFRVIKEEKKEDITVTLGDIITFGVQNLHTIFKENSDYKTKVILFKLYIIGLLEK